MEQHVDYQIEKYSFIDEQAPVRLVKQWDDVLNECLQSKASAEERVRIALLNVDYVSSFELPFRLLLTRTPQLINSMRAEFQLSQKNVVFNHRRYGCVYSLNNDMRSVPDIFNYKMQHRIRRIDESGLSSSPYQQIAKEIKIPKDRLKMALESGLQVTALDGMFWFGIQRIAADVLRLRKTGMKIATSRVNVSDTLTGTTRAIPGYGLASR